MAKEIVYSSEEAYNNAVRNGVTPLAQEQDVSDVNQPLDAPATEAIKNEMTPDERGEYVAQMMARYQAHGYVPTFEEAMDLRAWRAKQETSKWGMVTDAMEHTASTLANGAWELTKDVATLKAPKVIGSLVEGAALGTKNWMYMYEQAKYDEDSWLHKMLYDSHSSDQDYYWNLKQSIEVNKMIAKDEKEGIIVPHQINVGGMDIDLTNPAVVQAVSYVADPSWLLPELGIEATIAKGMRGASSILQLNEQLTKASVFATKKAGSLAEKVGEKAGALAGLVERTEDRLIESFKNLTGIDANIKGGGQAMYKDNLVRGAAEGVGANNLRIPAWGVTTMTWGAAKMTEVAAKTAQLGFELAGQEAVAGLRLSERIAAESSNTAVANLARTWSVTASPMLEWATASARTSLHSAMYGGAFGLVMGGEDGFYNGIGTGFVLGGAFHQVGAFHNAVAGGNAIQDVVKNFLWATQHFEYHNQEGLARLLQIVEKEGGTKAKLSTMSQVGAAERLQRNERRLYLTEERIKKMSTSPEWEKYKMLLDDPEFGGVTFHHTINGENVTIINVDRAAKSALSEELFHTILLNDRYAEPFKKAAVDALIGTEDNAGALYKMPKEDAVRLLESFRDSYLKLEGSVQGSTPEAMKAIHDDFNRSIEEFKRGQRPTVLRKAYEEFLASYWNRFMEEKPIDYLLNGGDLGVLRNTIEWGKDVYRDIMYKDLTASGANFKWGTNPDNFFIEQNTKQRIRIPMLDKLMRHYVREVGGDRYKGWKKNPVVHSDTGVAFARELEHLFDKEGGTKAELLSDEALSASHTKALFSIVDELSKSPSDKRGLKFSFYNGKSEQPDYTFQAAKNKPKKKNPKDKRPTHFDKEDTVAMPTSKSDEQHWDIVRKKVKQLFKEEVDTTLEESDIKNLRKKKGEIQEVDVEDNTGWDKMEETDDGFWKSNWQGNPRIKITGKATDYELKVLAKYLPENTVKRFAQLNNVIERSRQGMLGSISNTLQAPILTKSREREDGTRERGFKTRHSTFIPVEINMFFQRKKVGQPNEEGIQKFKMGDAQLLVKAIDMDAFMTRVDYAWNKLDEKSIDYKMVRRMFGSKENLVEAAKALLSNYSNGEKAEAGAKMFQTSTSSIREAAHMRDIVNAVIGFHPTQEMLKGGMRMIERSEGNYPLNMQKRNKDKKVSLPTVMTDFNITRVGTLRALDGEGFRYDHDNAYIRSQFNFSPAKGGRDHEGVFIPASAERILKNSVYRNKDGEVLSVYNLNKPTAERYKITTEPSVYDYVDEGLGRMFDVAIPTLRGSQYSTQSGWSHYTPDGYEAGIVSDKRLATGYIDTQRHLDISQIPHDADYRTVIDTVIQRAAEITSKNAEELLNDILKLRTEDGRTFRELYSSQPESILHHENESIDNWLLTRSNIDFFNNLGIHSVEYLARNEINGNEYSAVAVYDNARFIENVSKGSMAEQFSFSPAKTVSERFEQVAKKVGYEKALLEYVLDKDGNPVPNTRRISEHTVREIIEEEKAKINKSVETLKKLKLSPEEEHSRFINALKPFVISRLRKQFQFAPAPVLEKIADISLRGYNTTTGGNMIVKDTVFIKEARKYGITAKKLLETGIPTLAHAVEMTEAEFAAMKAYPKYEQMLREGGMNAEKEFVKTEEGRQILSLINQHIFTKHGGWSGFIEAIDKRHQNLMLLVNEEVMTRKTSDPLEITPANQKQIRELFIRKTRTFVEEVLRRDNMTLAQRSALNELYNLGRLEVANPESVIKDTFFDKESERAYARLQDLQHQIDSLFSREASDRVDDILTAYGIEGKNKDVIEWVRANLYDESARGLVKLGTPDAIKRAVQLYALYSKEGHNQVFDIQKAITKNYIEAMDSLERKGYYGSSWDLQSHAFKHYEAKDLDVTGTHMWRFDGAPHIIIERLPHNNELSTAESMKWKYLEMYDANGNVVLSDRYLKSASDKEADAFRKNFQRLATKRLDESLRKLRLFSDHYEVEGPKKDFILRSLLDEQGRPIPENFDNWELRSKGDTYVAIERNDAGTDIQSVLNKNGSYAGFKTLPEMNINDAGKQYDTGRTKFAPSGSKTTVKAEIETLKKILAEGVPITVRKEKKVRQIKEVKGVYKQGKPVYETVTKVVFEDSGKRRPLNSAETVHLRDQLTRLQKIQYSDTGTIFQIDGKYNFIFPEGKGAINTIEKRTKALQQLKSGESPNIGFDNYLKQLYTDFDKRLKERKRTEQKLIDKILSTGSEGNLAKIKELEAIIRQGESKWKQYIKNRTQALNAEQKKLKKPPLDILDVLNIIKGEMDAAQKGSVYHGDKVTVLEHQLRQYGALDRLALMSESEKDSWMTEYAFLKEYGTADQHLMAPDPSESKMAFVQRIKQQIIQSKQKQVEFRRKYDEINGLLDNNSKIRDDAEYQIEFLAQQYAAAKGHKLSDKFLREITEQEAVEGSGRSKYGITDTKISIDSLKNLGLHPRTAPRYMPDEFGVLGKGSKSFTTHEQYKQAFEEGIQYIRDRWHNSADKSGLELQGILDKGFEHIDADPNNEAKASKEIERLKRLGNIKDAKVIAWMQDPANKKFVDEVMQRYKDNYYDKDEVVKAIEERYDFEKLGKYGRILKGAEARLRETNASLANHFVELDSLTNISQAFGNQFRLPDGSLDLRSVDSIENIEKSKRAQEIVSIIRKLEAKRLALEKRIKNAIDSVEDPNAPADAHTEEFKRIVSERKIAQMVKDRVAENEKQNAAQMEQWRAEARAEAETLFQRYNDRAKQLGMPDSEVRIDPASPDTQRFFFMFPSLSWDFFGPIHSFDWSVTTDTYGPHAGESAVGETFRSLRGSTENEVATNERRRNAGRTVYLADYMYRAEQIKAYHEKNPDAKMTAEQAMLLQLFHPETTQDPVFLDKASKIAPDKLARQMELSQGIRDKFKSSTERERFLRTYAYEALQMLTSSQSLRIEAFKRLRGLNDVEFESFKNSRTPEQVEAALRDKEVIENAMYLIRDANGYAILKPQDTSNPYNWKTGEVVNGKEKPMLKGNKRQPFATGAGVHFGMPIDTLVRMEGFQKIWEEEMGAYTRGSMFDEGNQSYIKRKYEDMPLWQRMNLQTSTANKLMLENKQGMLQYQQEAAQRRADKPLWFPEQLDKVDHGGDFSKNAEYEYARVERLLSTTMAVEASIQKYKVEGVTSFITERQFALHHLLSLNDGLAFPNLDWSKPEEGTFRESNDGRYIIQMTGKDEYQVFFAGEKIKNADGVQVLEIPTVKMGVVNNPTEAQVLVRFYEDDIKSIRTASKLIAGGQNGAPWKVGNQPMPAYKNGELIKSIKHAPQFSETVIKLYEQNKGSPEYSQMMRDMLAEIGENGSNYGENQYVQFRDENGTVETRTILITPSAEGIYSKTHTRFVNSSGHTVWELKPVETPADKGAPAEVPSTNEAADNTHAQVNTADNPKPSEENKQVADASSWRIESTMPPKAGEVYPEWATIKNKLNYLMVRLRDDKGVSVFRLFNPASGYVGQFRREQEAVDAVLEQERKAR